MILVIGGIASGKQTWALSLGYDKADVFDAAVSHTFEALPIVANVQELVRDETADPVAIADAIAKGSQIALCTEVGSGIVPLTAEDRAWRDRVGALQTELAQQATCVVRMTCGIPQALKGVLPHNRKLQVVLMRHGSTKASERRAYAGATDVPLTAQGEREAHAAGVCPGIDVVYASPMQRAMHTAEICFPQAQVVPVDDLREMDFGTFEGRTADEMADDAAYRTWVDGGCLDRCPQGESRDELVLRVSSAIHGIVLDALCQDLNRVVVVAHGGTVMSAMHAFAQGQRDYFSWHVDPCEGYAATASIAQGRLAFTDEQRFTDLAFLESAPAGTQGHPAGQSFFQNRACKHFPCHAGIDEHEFNCLFCYCPLYALGAACGGDFTYTDAGRKNCTRCTAPHRGEDGVKLVAARYEELAALARMGCEK